MTQKNNWREWTTYWCRTKQRQIDEEKAENEEKKTGITKPREQEQKKMARSG